MVTLRCSTSSPAFTGDTLEDLKVVMSVRPCACNQQDFVHGYILIYKYKKQLQKIEKKVGMVYQKAYKQG